MTPLRFGGILYPLSDLWLAAEQHGWAGMKQHRRERAKYSVYIAVDRPELR